MKIAKRIIKIVFALIVLLVILAIVAIVITGGKIMFHALDTEGEFDYLIVLGTAVEGRDPSPMLEDRIKAAGKYLEENPDTVCVVTGAKLGDAEISEALCIYNELRLMGIPHDRILKEEKSTTTVENIQFAMDLIQKKNGDQPKTVGIVSNEFHLFRASMIAESLDVQAVPVAASTSSIKDFFTYFVREIFVVWKDWFYLKLH